MRKEIIMRFYQGFEIYHLVILSLFPCLFVSKRFLSLIHILYTLSKPTHNDLTLYIKNL